MTQKSDQRERDAYRTGRHAGLEDACPSQFAPSMGGRSSPLWQSFMLGYLEGRKERLRNLEAQRKGGGHVR
jgi:hypothetical protein